MNAPALPDSDDTSPVMRSCIRDRIRDELMQRILSGDLKPGERLKELGLAAEFDVSQAPVREALRELETLGLVISERYRGSRVRAFDRQELLDAYELRATLEVRALELAGCPSGARLKQLEHLLERMRQNLSTDLSSYIEAAVSLHRQIVESCGNRAILGAWETYNWPVRAHMAVMRMSEQQARLARMLEHHVELLSSLRASNLGTAAVQLRQIFSIFMDMLGEEPASPTA